MREHRGNERCSQGMKMTIVLAAVLCCILTPVNSQGLYPSLEGVTEASPAPSLYTAVVNLLFDQVLNSISKSGALDPLNVPNTTRRFETKFIVKVEAQAGLYSGRLTGLSTLHRTGDCRVNVGSQGLEMRVDLGAGPVRATYRGEVKLMAVSQDVTIECDVNSMQIIVEAVQKPGAKPELQRFSVQRLQGVRVQVQGLGALGGVANALSVVLTSVFEEEIRRAVEDSVRNLFSEKLAELASSIPGALAALG
ncbi:mite allergen Lep d 7-like isoform X1 [Haemaphysalis longicornis]